MKYIALLVLGFALGAWFQYRADSWIVADILRSDDTSITRNVEEANALLDLYEQGYGKQ